MDIDRDGGTGTDTSVLDDPIRSSLTGHHRHLAQRHGRILRYRDDVSIFAAFPHDPGPADWADAAEFFGPGGTVPISGVMPTPPPGWEITMSLPGVQMIARSVAAMADRSAVVLTDDDVPAMMDLVARTRPGPFLPRTIEMGTYRGIIADGALIAMAGERLHPVGATEISAVCTDPAYRGQGLAARLVLAVADGIVRRGETPFLHAAADNRGAIRLYESLGFELRKELTFGSIRVPE
ncbi:GNAT family N-acetyltransferase [Gordonia sp. DT30]|uniref:GNAT family N-acetyltransferase n=1 Tax=Gordonia sp. DT30 TaxID=3416546 RepID=UPI003CECF20A